MTHQAPPEHFKGKNVAEHLRDARKKGAVATAEVHGTELPGHFSAAADSAKETALAFLILWAIGTTLGYPLLIPFIAFGFGWFLWKTGRSALLGWGRLERLHRVIEEERWEIEHHRDQEKQELREMYEAKGFSGKLLDEVVDVLMADDNRLLRVMLEEELGLSLEVYEHPLKQALGAALGVLITATAALCAYYFWPYFGIPLICLLVVIIASKMTAKYEKRRLLNSVIWNFALTLFVTASVYFLGKLIG
ncbi:MAG: hypothetical protein K1000chlam2_00491 [Chlamydiae bacterium]|nr:hypothetical protein [Chlamydiota bacterium]